MSENGGGARPGGSEGLFLGVPPRVLAELKEVSEADVLTVYFSDPAAAFDRSSYVLIGALGVDEDYRPFMRGALSPSSLRLFSAHDRAPTLVVEAVEEDERFASSSFNREHGIVSLVRLSVRLTTTAPPTGRAAHRPRQLPPMVEVFASYRQKLSADRLESLADAVREAIQKDSERIRSAEGLKSLLNARAFAKKARRVDRIASELADAWDHDQPTRALRRLIDNALRELGRFVLDVFHRHTRDSSVSFHLSQTWSGPDGRQEIEPLALGTLPESRARDIERSLTYRRDVGLCRFAAEQSTSVVIEDRAKVNDTWRARLAAESESGLLVTIPLFAGSKVVAVMHLESRTPGLPPLAGPTLCRVTPQIERLVQDLISYVAFADMITIREMVRRINTYDMAPQGLAVLQRLGLMGSFLRAAEVAFVEWEDGARTTERWTSAKAAGAEEWAELRNASQAIATPELVRLFEESPHSCLLRVQRLVARDGSPRVIAHEYRITRETEVGRVHRVERDEESLRALVPALEIDDAAKPAPTEDHLILPLWQVWSGDPTKRHVKGLLTISRRDSRFTLTPHRVENLNAISKAFAHSVFSILSLARRDALYASATAGVGPVHDLIHVATLCGHDIDQLEGDPERLEAARERMSLLREQLWLWHQFSTPGATLSLGEERTPLKAVLETVIRRVNVLKGKSKVPDLAIKEEDARAEIPTGLTEGITAVLVNVLSNSVKFGRGIDRVAAGIDRARRLVWIQVINKAHRERLERSLRKAVTITRRIREGQAQEVFVDLVKRGAAPGRQGVGTWLASVVTQQLLGGEYHLSFEPCPDDGTLLTVTAEITFPLRAPLDAESSGEETAAG